MKVDFDVKFNKIVYENNGYKIVKCIDNENDEDITLVGHFMPLYEEESYIGNGKLVYHQKYGEQIVVASIEQKVALQADKMIDYLSSGMFFGIGKKTAKKIVEVVGDDPINKILADETVLDDVSGMSTRKIKKLVKKLQDLNDTSNAFNYLLSLGITQKQASRLYNDYDNEIVDILTDDVFKIYYAASNRYSFKFISELAAKLNYQDYRLDSANLYYKISQMLFNSGSTYLSLEKLHTKNLEALITYLVDIDVLYLISANKVTIKKIYDYEVLIANFIKNKYDKSIKSDIDLDGAINEYEKRQDIKFSSSQVKAISNALTNRLAIITGGPGTGKTTVIGAICNIFLTYYDLNLKDTIFENDLVLLAPTGRAAKMMSTKTKIPASTIHRYLKWDIDSNEFEYNERYKSKAKVVILDEMSMIDTYLFASLIKALDEDVILVMVGDDQQLSAVGIGDILRDLILCNKLSVNTLVDVYRQSSNSLVGFMHEVRQFNVPNDLTTKYNDRNFIRCKDQEIFESVTKVLTKIKTKNLDIFDFQILLPMYRSSVGIDAINRLCQNIFNDSKNKHVVFNNNKFIVGDKVLLTKNYPNDNVYNGDLGTIIDVNAINKLTLKIKFDTDNIVEFSGDDLYAIMLGYAISIHKSQGSEFKHIILPVCLSHKVMLTHRLIYTAITRAKESLLIIGEASTFVNSVCNSSENNRRTSLLSLIESQSVEVTPFDFMEEVL